MCMYFVPRTRRECGAGRRPCARPGAAHLPHGTWPVLRLSDAPTHTRPPAPRPTSAKLAAWRCQPLTHLPPEARAEGPSPTPFPAPPTPPQATESPFPLASSPHTGLPALATLPLPHPDDCSPPRAPVPLCNPHPRLAVGQKGSGPPAQQPWALSRPGWGALPQIVPAAPTLCTAPQGWGGGAVLPAPFQGASVDWTHPSTGLGHPSHPHCPPPPPHP